MLVLTTALPIRTTTLAYVANVVQPNWLLGIALLSVAGMAIVALAIKSAFAVLLLLPQQFLLLLSSVSAVQAMVLGQFGDGVQRPHVFIVADQLPAVILDAARQLRRHA